MSGLREVSGEGGVWFRALRGVGFGVEGFWVFVGGGF